MPVVLPALQQVSHRPVIYKGRNYRERQIALLAAWAGSARAIGQGTARAGSTIRDECPPTDVADRFGAITWLIAVKAELRRVAVDEQGGTADQSCLP